MAGHFSRIKFLSEAHRFLLGRANKRIPSLSYCSRNLLSTTASDVDISSERISNIVYSRHEDCKLHNLTVVQRFFQQSSQRPNNVALVICKSNKLE